MFKTITLYLLTIFLNTCILNGSVHMPGSQHKELSDEKMLRFKAIRESLSSGNSLCSHKLKTHYEGPADIINKERYDRYVKVAKERHDRYMKDVNFVLRNGYSKYLEMLEKREIERFRRLLEGDSTYFFE